MTERRSGRFEGYRVNCEFVPCLPARVVADCLTDPRRIPYLLVWTRRTLPIERGSNAADFLGGPREAVRIVPASTGWVEIERWDGTRTNLRVLSRALPRHPGKSTLLICNCCGRPRRALYAREAIKHRRCLCRADWPCRKCAELSYASEGGALVYRSRWGVTRLLSGLRLVNRPERWEPVVFTSPLQMLDSGLVHNLYFDSGLGNVSNELWKVNLTWAKNTRRRLKTLWMV